MIIPSLHWPRTRTYFSLLLYLVVCGIKQNGLKHAMTSAQCFFDYARVASLIFSTTHNCFYYVFSIVTNEVSRNFVLAPQSVMITIS